MIRILISLFVTYNVYSKPFLANSVIDAHIYDENNSPLIQYRVDPTKAPLLNDSCCTNDAATVARDANNATKEGDNATNTQLIATKEGDNATNTQLIATKEVDNATNTQLIATKEGDNATITQLIDLLRVFRVVQLKQLQKYLSESLVNTQYENSREDYSTADRFHSQHRDLSMLRNKSVVVIEQIFKEIVSNKSIQKLWCDKQRNLKGENCSLAELWKLFNMTLSAAPRHKTSYFIKSGDFVSKSVLSNVTAQQEVPTTPLNETLAGNVTVELTVRMDGHTIGNVEMAKSYYENGGNSSNHSRENSSSSLPKPYKLIIYNDLTEDSIRADSASGEYNVEHDAAQNTSTAKPASQSESHVPPGESEREKEWSDTNIDEHNKTFNPMFNELHELDPNLLSENLFNEEASGWDIDALHINASDSTYNNSSNSTTVVLLPEPLQSNYSSNSSTYLKEKEKYSTSDVFNNSKEQYAPNNSMLAEVLKLRDSSDLYIEHSRPTAGKDQSEFTSTIAQLFDLLLSNKTLQIVQQASSSSHDGTLRDKYYTDIIELLKLLKQTLNQLQVTHDSGTENLLLTTLTHLVKMLTFIDASLVSLSQTENKKDRRTFSSRSVKANTSLSKVLFHRDVLTSRYSTKPTPQRAMAYGDLGDVKNSTEKQSKKIGLSVAELKQLLPSL